MNKGAKTVAIWGIILLIGLLICIWVLIADPNSKVEVVWDPSVSETQVAHVGVGAEIASETNNILTPVIYVGAKVFCPVCQEKGLKSSVYVGHTTGTLIWNQPYYDEEGNYHYVDTNTYTTSYTCSLGHAWYESSCAGEEWNRITKDTEDEIIEMRELEDVTSEGESIEFGIDGEVVIYLKPTVSMTFGDNVGKLSWGKGILEFEGNALQSAETFFLYFLKPIVDKYIKYELEKGELAIEVPEVDLILITASGYEVDPIPDAFIKTRGFDPSKYLQDSRLKLDIEGKIYWIRLEED